MSARQPIADSDLETLQRETFGYFMHEANVENGLIRDKTAKDWPASIAATGLALAACEIASNNDLTRLAVYLVKLVANNRDLRGRVSRPIVTPQNSSISQ